MEVKIVDLKLERYNGMCYVFLDGELVGEFDDEELTEYLSKRLFHSDSEPIREVLLSFLIEKYTSRIESLLRGLNELLEKVLGQSEEDYAERWEIDVEDDKTYF